MDMTNKTPKYRLETNDRYEQKLKRKNVIFKQLDDSDLLKAIESDKEGFSPLVIRLLREYYNIYDD